MSNIKNWKGFNEYLSNNLLLYHGSFNNFETFDASKINKSGAQTTYGVGIYATDNIDYAKSYITGENGIGDGNTKGILYTLRITNPNFLNFGTSSDNNKITHLTIDSDNYNRIIKQLNVEKVTVDIQQTDTVWTVYTKLVNNIFENVFTIKQQFKYGDFYAKKEVSEFLYRCGIDGLKYPLDSSSKINTSYGYDGYGYVIYNAHVINNIEKK